MASGLDRRTSRTSGVSHSSMGSDRKGNMNPSPDVSILKGGLSYLPKIPTNTVKIYISSNKTDMDWEHRTLWEEILPDLQNHFLIKGIDVHLVDPQQGIDIDRTFDRQAFNTQLREIEDCAHTSMGPFFVCLLGNKYGPVPLPAYIEEAEFSHMRNEASEADLKLLEDWYVHDSNSSPPVYRLQPITRSFPNYYNRDTDKHEAYEKDVRAWRATFRQLQSTVQHAARVCYQEGRINQAHAHKQNKYFVSGVQQESERALQLGAPNCLFVHRLLDNPSGMEHGVDKYVDVKGDDEIDLVAQQRLQDFRNWIPEHVPKSNNMIFRVRCKTGGVDPCINEEHARYLQDFMDKVRSFIQSGIEKFIQKDNSAFKDTSGREPKPGFFNEILAHLRRCRSFSKMRQQGFVNVQLLIKKQLEYGVNDEHQMILVYGPDGCGKSTLLSSIANIARECLGGEITLIVRYIGLTPLSQSTMDILRNICVQLSCILDESKDEIEELHTLNLTRLINTFQMLLLDLATCGKTPLVILLDGVESMKSDNGMSEPKIDWLAILLPPGIHLVAVFNVLHSNDEMFSNLSAKLRRDKCLVEVPALEDSHINSLINDYLAQYQLNFTILQKTTLCNVIRQCPRPLFAKLLLHDARSWISSYKPNGSDLPSSLEGIIQGKFDVLEKKYGEAVVSRVLRYLTSGLWGLTELELLDLLSCNNDLLLHVLPMEASIMLRFPIVLWLSIASDLNALLATYHVDYKRLYNWSHKAVALVACQKYRVNTDDIKQSHKDVSDLFLDTWVGNKPLVVPDKKIQIIDEGQRYICQQPLLYSETRYNYRRLRELWYQLLQTGAVSNFKEHSFCNFEYLLAKLHGTSVHSLTSDLDLTFSHILDADLYLILRCITQAVDILSENPLQLANELIGRLRQIKEHYTKHIEPLVQQCMEWCDCYSLPILVPLSSWLPDPRNPLVTSFRCSDGVEKVCPSPNGQHVLCSTPRHEIKMYHVPSKRHIKTLFGHKGPITCLQMCHGRQMNQAQMMLSGATDCTVCMWDITTGKLINCFREHKDAVLCLAVTKNDETLISGSKDCTIKCVSMTSGELLRTISAHDEPVTCLGLYSNDSILVSASMDHKVKLWCMEDMSLLNTIDEGIDSSIISMALSKDNTFLLLGCADESLHVKSLTTGSHIHQLVGHKGRVESLDVSADSFHCVAGCSDGSVFIYNLRTQQLLEHFHTKQGNVSHVILSADEHFIFCAAQDEVQVWSLLRSKSLMDTYVSDEHTSEILAMEISQDGKLAISGSRDSMVKLWNLEISLFSYTLDAHQDAVTCVALAGDLAFAASGSDDCSVKIWSLTAYCVITNYQEHDSPVVSVFVLSDNQRVLSADADHVIKMWLAENGVTELAVTGPVHRLQVAPNGALAAAGEENDMSVKLWLVPDGSLIKAVSHSDVITCVVFSNDSQYLVTGSQDKSLKVWEAPTGKLTQVLVEHEDHVTCAAITDDNKYIVSGSADHCLMVWSLSRGTVEHIMSDHVDKVTCVRITKDSTIAISGSNDGTIRVWNLFHGLLITTFDMHYVVADLRLTPDALRVVVRLDGHCNLPLMCLHNSPAGEIKSQSQISIQIRGDSPYLPLRPRPLFYHATTRYAAPRRLRPEGRPPSVSTIPEIIKVTPSKAPLQKTIKAQEITKVARSKTAMKGRREKKQSEESSKKSNMCMIV